MKRWDQDTGIILGSADGGFQDHRRVHSLLVVLVLCRSPLVCFQLVPKLTRNFMKEGFMEKTGPKVRLSSVIRI